MTHTRTIQCTSCPEAFAIELEGKWNPNRVESCPRCGTEIINHAEAEAIAERDLTLEEAREIIAPHSYDDIMKWAAIGFNDPALISPDELKVIKAYIRVRSSKEKQH